MTKSDPGQATKPPSESREQRLAKALRANLRRRKAPVAPDSEPAGPRDSSQESD
jgi:hypothetical protein